MSDASDLEGPCGLRWIQLEVNRGPGYFGQGKALPHWGGHMKRLLGLHLAVEGDKCQILESFLMDTIFSKIIDGLLCFILPVFGWWQDDNLPNLLVFCLCCIWSTYIPPCAVGLAKEAHLRTNQGQAFGHQNVALTVMKRRADDKWNWISSFFFFFFWQTKTNLGRPCV